MLADKGYDSDKIIKQALYQGMGPVPPGKNRKIQRPYDRICITMRHNI
jgi:hypothetical protein